MTIEKRQIERKLKMQLRLFSFEIPGLIKINLVVSRFVASKNIIFELLDCQNKKKK